MLNSLDNDGKYIIFLGFGGSELIFPAPSQLDFGRITEIN